MRLTLTWVITSFLGEDHQNFSKTFNSNVQLHKPEEHKRAPRISEHAGRAGQSSETKRRHRASSYPAPWVGGGWGLQGRHKASSYPAIRVRRWLRSLGWAQGVFLHNSMSGEVAEVSRIFPLHDVGSLLTLLWPGKLLMDVLFMGELPLLSSALDHGLWGCRVPLNRIHRNPWQCHCLNRNSVYFANHAMTKLMKEVIWRVWFNSLISSDVSIIEQMKTMPNKRSHQLFFSSFGFRSMLIQQPLFK